MHCGNRVVAYALGALAGGFACVAAALAQAPSSAPPDPAQEAARLAFERLDEPERRAIQFDLIWTGDYNGVAAGEFGKRTFDALVAFERRTRGTPDGILAADERAALAREAETARGRMRFQPLTDQATGIRIGVPGALLTQRVAVDSGTVYRSQDGQTTLQLLDMPPAASFQALFDSMRQSTPQRRVTYRLFRPDWFVISGDEGRRRFYTRVAQGPQGLKAYTFRYPIESAASLDRLMIAIANSFEPFPDSAVAATPPARPDSGGTSPAPGATAARNMLTGLRLAPDLVLTSAAGLRGCARPALDGKPVPAGAVTTRGDVALVRAASGSGPASVPALGPQPSAGADAFVLSFDGGDGRQPVVAPGRFESGTVLSAGLQEGAPGAPVFDSEGRLSGIVTAAPGRLARIGSVTAAASFQVAALADIAPDLPQASDAGGGASPMVRLAAAARSAVAIDCGG